MSFIFYINNGFATVASLEQVQGYYQNLGSYYSNNDQFYSTSNYPQTFLPTDFYSHCEPLPTTITHTLKDQKEPELKNQFNSLVKPKRKMEKSLEKQILSAKKNSESNIINQFYSFFSSRQRSLSIVQRCIKIMGKSNQQTQKILPIFYMTIKFINAKRGRKYVNSAMFLKFFIAKQLNQYLKEMKDKILNLQFLSIQQLCQILRRCAQYYLKQVSINAVLTSKRISIISKEQHLKKRRKVLKTIIQH